MKITRTIALPDTDISISIELTEWELKKAHGEYQFLLDAHATYDELILDPYHAYMQNLLSAGIAETEDEAGMLARAYFREHYAADLALNDEGVSADA
jgi:hypothetical protein